MSSVIVVMAKEPVAGRVKTRLGRDIGHETASRLAAAFLADSLETAGRVPGANLLVAHDPPSARAWFERHALPLGATLIEQPDGTLGARMGAAFAHAFAAGATRCVMIGMDTPHLPMERLGDALAALEQHDVCLGPSADGGYYLVGLTRYHAGLFSDIDWSTPLVLGQTLERAADLALRVTQLPEERDVDVAADLDEVRARLRERPGVGTRTRGALRELA